MNDFIEFKNGANENDALKMLGVNTFGLTPKKANMTFLKVKEYLNDPDIKAFNLGLATMMFADRSMNLSDSDRLNDHVYVKTTLESYFKTCLDDDVMPTIATMCVFLGVTRDSLYKYSRDPYYQDQELLAKSILLCQAYAENAVVNGAMDSKIYSFLGKNYYGLSDDTKLTITPGVPQMQVIDANDTANAIREQILFESNSKDE